jgi:hypothetical protein
VFTAGGRNQSPGADRSPQRPLEVKDELWLIDLTTLAVVDRRREGGDLDEHLDPVELLAGRHGVVFLEVRGGLVDGWVAAV